MGGLASPARCSSGAWTHSLAPCTGMRGRRNSPNVPHHGAGGHPLGCPVFFHPGSPFLIPSPLVLSPPHLPARVHGAGQRCQHPQEPPGVHTREPGQAHATHTPASGQPHSTQICWFLTSQTLLATAAPLLNTRPLHSHGLGTKWPGRAGSSGRRRCNPWLRTRLDLLPTWRATSPPSPRGNPAQSSPPPPCSSHKLCSSPRAGQERGEIQVLLTSLHSPGKAAPQSHTTAAFPQYPAHEEKVSIQKGLGSATQPFWG